MFQIATVPRLGLNTNLLVIFLSKKFVKLRQKSFSGFPKDIHQDIQKFLEYKDFKGELNETALIYTNKSKKVERIFMIGLGDGEEPNADEARLIGFNIAEMQEKIRARRVHLYLGNLKVCHIDFIRYITEGIYFQRYRFLEYKTEPSKREIKTKFIYVCHKKEYTPRFRQTVVEVQNFMAGVTITKDLANQPANYLNPEKLVEFVRMHFKDTPHITLEILDRKSLEKKGLNAILAVARGSAQPPYLILIKYTPSKKSTKSLALVGKGVTFDSGGISIKPAANMDEMKYDMSGAAAVIGSMHVVNLQQPAMNVYGIIPAVENMPGGNATRPGDIIKAYNGKTIEILNTDAEGRLILADALAYTVDRIKPNIIIDFATLTGACVVALGDKRAGLFTKDEKLKNILTQYSETAGDLLWPMPMDDIYNKDLESDVADIKNIGSRWAGAITAAKFLEHFVGKVRWAHIDMAGTANHVKHKEYLGKGATGFGPRLIGSSLNKIEKNM